MPGRAAPRNDSSACDRACPASRGPRRTRRRRSGCSGREIREEARWVKTRARRSRLGDERGDDETTDAARDSAALDLRLRDRDPPRCRRPWRLPSARGSGYVRTVSTGTTSDVGHRERLLLPVRVRGQHQDTASSLPTERTTMPAQISRRLTRLTLILASTIAFGVAVAPAAAADPGSRQEPTTGGASCRHGSTPSPAVRPRHRRQT